MGLDGELLKTATIGQPLSDNLARKIVDQSDEELRHPCRLCVVLFMLSKCCSKSKIEYRR